VKKAPPKNAALKKALPWIIVAAVVIVIGVLLFQPSSGGGMRKVDSAGLLEAQKKGAQIVDVRTTGEFELGHIAGAINVPVDELQTRAASWDKNASYVVYCASGARSAEAQQMMQSMGFKSVADLTGGVATWTGQLEKGASTSKATIPTSGKPVMIELYTPT
jgi:rhodanese-related sulfurtransferase